jgi:hypothetical protein
VKSRYLWSALAILGSAGPALADIPVSDAAQLTQKSETASTTVKLAPVTTQRQNAHQGVHCAVTSGKKADLTNPTVQPQAGAGAQAIQSYSPDQPLTPNTAAQGADLNSQTLFQSAGTVVGGVNAGQATMSAAQSAFQTASQQVGTAPTIMAAFDMNSAARLQNNLAWNGAIAAANLWLTAINALNLAAASDTSRAAAGMQTSTSQGPAICPVGTIGSGTAADPCRTPATCQPTANANDNACVSARYVDTNGDVLFYLTQVQNAAAAASTGR